MADPHGIDDVARNINEMADTFRQYAKELDKHAEDMRKTGDITLAQEAMSCFVNCIGNCNLIKLTSQSIRVAKRMGSE